MIERPILPTSSDAHTPLNTFLDAASDAIAHTIARVERDARQSEELRAAEHRAFMAEQREALAEMKRALETRIATVKDGDKGEKGDRGDKGDKGNDGFNLEDFDIERGEDQRTIVLSFTRGETRHEYELTLRHPLYCGVFKDGQSYMIGDCVTFGGSMWIAQKDEPGKPDTPESGWQLAVKKGRDGRSAK